MYITHDEAVPIDEAANLIITTPRRKYLLIGEPGNGKTSVAHTILERLGPKYYLVLVRCNSVYEGDLVVVNVMREGQWCEYKVNSLFEPPAPGMIPVIVLDEITKASRAVLGQVLPTTEPFKPRLGNWEPPEGTIVYGTGNPPAAGVGDTLEAHSGNRFIRLHVRKFTAQEVIEKTIRPRGYEPVLHSLLEHHPDLCASYMDPGQERNEAIFNPDHPERPFVSLRSLEQVDEVLKRREGLSHNELRQALRGAIGPYTAGLVLALLAEQSKLPSPREIMSDPANARLPDNDAAARLLITAITARADVRSNYEPLMKYVTRLSNEHQGWFFSAMMSEGEQKALSKYGVFRDWLLANQAAL